MLPPAAAPSGRFVRNAPVDFGWITASIVVPAPVAINLFAATTLFGLEVFADSVQCDNPPPPEIPVKQEPSPQNLVALTIPVAVTVAIPAIVTL